MPMIETRDGAHAAWDKDVFVISPAFAISGY